MWHGYVYRGNGGEFNYLGAGICKQGAMDRNLLQKFHVIGSPARVMKGSVYKCKERFK